ncbi:4-diphosphocytidyl-2-C-methyl-D-erythritol kinase [Flexibacter flexilis DSM 6793]|uniref:4-diphosphocytidyl-2-C-methyl-D-erythritol kinase n=1 Tax=Flexibacter flexilis DSM 6793 TaxID=927664 RepID=A0A1I1LJF8_9BACT|nr:4-(cytidine 5'-diphospho)-2-C-methyl-D-erythritol kinase [Flexibacter flexilis]SFC70473.1 4-diphosphocytidyl-2-C-methyl-D-erythritol kinase [Flexibacter flexilis DSM 6793]
MQKISLRANAKINIGLHITAKRPDGYHDIESCFYPVGWADEIQISVVEQTTFSYEGLPIQGATADNLCLKAYYSLKKDFPALPDVHIHLVKNVPIGAGMGGGSSDAAFTLKGLNQLFNLGLNNSQLEDYARKLGSDCAFFVENKPTLATEKGDVFSPLGLSLAGKYIVIVYPSLHVSTAEAYSGVKPTQPATALDVLLKAPLETWRETVQNDFEGSVAAKYSQITDLKTDLYGFGAAYASMTGSGSAVFGILEKSVNDSVLAHFEQKQYSVWAGILE